MTAVKHAKIILHFLLSNLFTSQLPLKIPIKPPIKKLIKRVRLIFESDKSALLTADKEIIKIHASEVPTAMR